MLQRRGEVRGTALLVGVDEGEVEWTDTFAMSSSLSGVHEAVVG